MRKWINERLKRRKKAGDKPAKDAAKAPEPLQPRFYDDDAPPSAKPIVAEAEPVTEPAAVPVRARRSSRPAPEPPAELSPAPEPVAEPASSDAEPGPRTSRRRRSRGRRGGTRQRPVAAAATTEPSAEEALLPEASSGALALEDAAPLQPEAAVRTAPVAASSPASSQTASRTPQTAPVQARASKGTVVLAIGLPGSGKSSWFKRHNIHPLSSDLLRELLFDDAQEQRFQDLVFSNLRSMLKARLIARRPMNYVDATNLTPHDRHSWIKLAKDYGYDVQGVYFDVPVEICMERHQKRGRVVPEDIMRKMAGKMKAPTFEEGFSKITVVRVKQKEAAAE
jgi:predicted kinase